MNLIRRLLGASGGAETAAREAAFGNPDQPLQGAIDTTPAALSDPGTAEPRARQPVSLVPEPAADGRRRNADVLVLFQLRAEAHSGRRLGARSHGERISRSRRRSPPSTCGSAPAAFASCIGIWRPNGASITNGACRVTVLDEVGRAYVQDVRQGEIWYFPPGQPHSLARPWSRWLRIPHRLRRWPRLRIQHAARDRLARAYAARRSRPNFGAPAELFKNIPLHDSWIFQGEEPGPLAEDQAAVAEGGAPPNPFTFSLERREADPRRPPRARSASPTAPPSRSRPRSRRPC